MPQEFQVLQCYNCKTFQVQQMKKVNKWGCKMCGEKQSVQRVYGRGCGADCRKHVQKLNMMQGELEQQLPRQPASQPMVGAGDSSQKLTADDIDGGSIQQTHRTKSATGASSTSSRWAGYIARDEHENEADFDHDDPMYTTDATQFLGAGSSGSSKGRKRKSSTEPYSLKKQNEMFENKRYAFDGSIEETLLHEHQKSHKAPQNHPMPFGTNSRRHGDKNNDGVVNKFLYQKNFASNSASTGKLNHLTLFHKNREQDDRNSDSVISINQNKLMPNNVPNRKSNQWMTDSYQGNKEHYYRNNDSINQTNLQSNRAINGKPDQWLSDLSHIDHVTSDSARPNYRENCSSESLLLLKPQAPINVNRQKSHGADKTNQYIADQGIIGEHTNPAGKSIGETLVDNLSSVSCTSFCDNMDGRSVEKKQKVAIETETTGLKLNTGSSKWGKYLNAASDQVKGNSESGISDNELNGDELFGLYNDVKEEWEGLCSIDW